MYPRCVTLHTYRQKQRMVLELLVGSRHKGSMAPAALRTQSMLPGNRGLQPREDSLGQTGNWPKANQQRAYAKAEDLRSEVAPQFTWFTSHYITQISSRPYPHTPWPRPRPSDSALSRRLDHASQCETRPGGSACHEAVGLVRLSTMPFVRHRRATTDTCSLYGLAGCGLQRKGLRSSSQRRP
jgi:hypothetical protein